MFNTLKTKDKMKSGLCFVNNYGKIMAKMNILALLLLNVFWTLKKRLCQDCDLSAYG